MSAKINAQDLIKFTARGMYCPAGDFYIDPWGPVKKAIITHGHADHARYGHAHYLCHTDSEAILQARLGKDISTETLPYGKAVTRNGVRISMHPAGHIPGSAQIRLEYQGAVWVASGDYKTEDDGFSPAFEPVKCHAFITESTFGLPVYQWQKQEAIIAEVMSWWQANQAAGLCSVLVAYSLGKAQRIINQLPLSLGPILTHGAVEDMNAVLRTTGYTLRETQQLTASTPKELIQKSLIIAPPAVADSAWLRKLQPYSLAFASGWMGLRGARRRRAADRGFVLSDHADWAGLNAAIEATGASRVIVTHGYQAALTRWLQDKGIDASEEQTLFEGDETGQEGAQ